MAVDPWDRSRVDWGYIFDPKQADPLERLKTFLETGGDLHAISAKSEEGNVFQLPCLPAATKMRNAAAVSLLLAHRIDVNQKLCRLHYFTTFETAIMVAAEQADCEIAEILLSQQNVDLDGYHYFSSSGVMLKAAVSGRRRITEMLFDAGTPLLPTGREKERTPFQVACKLHFPDPFWFYVMHGLARFRENREEPPKPESPPVWVLDSLSKIQPGNEVIARLEASLLELVFPGTQQKPLHVKELCQRCEVLPSEILRAREERLAKWKGDALSFNYGFIKRCEICRVELMDHRLLPEEFKRARVIDPDSERYEAHLYNNEDDLTCLRKVVKDEALNTTGSHGVYSFAFYWLLRCLKSHPECTENDRIPQLPKRVIDVGSEDSKDPIHIHETIPEQKGYYLALSYRWGRDPVKLLEENLESYKTALPVQDLSQVIQNAIEVTRKLGIKYLWVDALCIMQDSKAEWESEIQSMDRVFRQALLTIAANVEPSGGRTGMFRSRESHNSSGNVGLRGPGVLETRGWTLQEQVLSRRMLIFTEDEVYWTCVGIDASISEPAGIKARDMGPTREGQVRMLQRYLRGFGRDDRFFLRNTYVVWLTLVTEYSRRDLTNGSDRLAALAGIQSAIGTMLGDECVAGIWRSQLGAHMLWWIGDETEPVSYLHNKRYYPFHRDIEPTFRPAAEFEAPSWSWACMSGPIWYCRLQDRLKTPPASSDDLEIIVDVHSVSVQIKGPSKIEGSVTLTGSLLKATATINDQDGRPYLHAEAYCAPCSSHGTPTQHGFVVRPWMPDTKPPAEGDIFCLHLKNAFQQWSVCLVPTGNNPKVYRRVGAVMWRDGHDSDHIFPAARHPTARHQNFVDIVAVERGRDSGSWRFKKDGPRLYPQSWAETLTIV
ncbi:hypothetical protein DPSP01_004017 [Paraphaeosphaeria sporulosa]|uniref:HET-domain-containing protein n=1 Tax=Paraphaeosphaeria sporulosa TaxID=1460663 RepID=A0A177CV75_9PLEO|nr:HET-domain-containing protein [Paraphaeosphaeria sporulosa]OAG10918.1 HET-domain-containing protein [Paraphaeosphaeria sporulosa]